MTDELRAELTEVREALAAVRAAMSHADGAGERLRSAKDWGLYDTFFGGGLVSSWVKRDRITEVNDRIRSLDQSLEVARKELADVGIGQVGGVGVSDLTLTLDVWFDNIFSDLMTQSKLNEAAERLRSVGTVLGRLLSELGRREADLVVQIGE